MKENMPSTLVALSDDEVMYPSFHYDGKKLLKLPGKEGTMTIKYRKVSRSESENSDGDTRYSCTIEVREIISAESDEMDAPASGRNHETEEALDALAKVKRKEHESDEDDEY